MPLLSAYERKARLTPGLISIVPIAVTIATLGLKRFPVIAIASSLLGIAGGTYLLAVLVAHFGRSIQTRLFNGNGIPTTQLLRANSQVVNSTQRDIWRHALTKVTGVDLLDVTQEVSNPGKADDTIQAAVGQVLYLGQDGGIPAVVAENTQYGLERNLYGFRWIGRGIAAGACLITLTAALFLPRSVAWPVALSGLVVNLLFLIAWMAVPSAERAKKAGFRYAHQLLHAVVNVSKSKLTA